MISMTNKEQLAELSTLLVKWDVPDFILNINTDRICCIISSSIRIYKITCDDSNCGLHLNLHNNMCAFGKHCYVISCSGKFCDVSGFSDGIGELQNVPVVDAVIVYNCHVTHQCYLLIVNC